MTLKRHHRERLLRLADKLEGKGPYADVGPVPVKKFDISDTLEGNDPNDCGFSACAVGWAIIDPWFKKRGLIWHGVWSAKGAQQFFGIANPDVDYLFMPESYRPPRYNPRPATVAKRIRTFVEARS